MYGFVERSIDLSENSEELRLEDKLDLLPFEHNFLGSEGWIYYSLSTNMFLYEAGQRRNQRKYHTHNYQEHDVGE